MNEDFQLFSYGIVSDFLAYFIDKKRNKYFQNLTRLGKCR